MSGPIMRHPTPGGQSQVWVCAGVPQRLAEQFDVARATIVRRLLAGAIPDTCPASWHLRVAERHGERDRPVRRAADQTGEG
jgi:hypothetical protein